MIDGMRYQPTLDHGMKVERSIEQMRLASRMSERYYSKPLLLCYSGGKDSDTLVELARMSGIRFEVQHSLTTADAPETVKHVRATFARLEDDGIKCSIIHPTYKGKPVSMWSLIPQKLMPPTRIVRYCCAVLKETGGRGRAICTGVRRAESNARSGRKFANNFSRSRHEALDFEDAADLFEHADSFAEHDSDFLRSCRMRGSTAFQPILEWLDDDVWQFLFERRVPTNPLYAEGFKRVGCVGCPMADRRRRRDFERWPQYAEAYKRAFSKMLDERKKRGKETEWADAQEVFDWWMEDA